MWARRVFFLKDVLIISLTAFGGPQAHMALFLDILVKKRGYLSEEELIELYALCQILPGPTSTQTITAIGFKRGGANLAYLTLLIWALPAVIFMTSAALLFNSFNSKEISLDFMRFLQPIAVGFVVYAAWVIATKVITTNLAAFLLVASAVLSYYFHSPFVFPAILIVAGVITSFKYHEQPKEDKEKIKIKWSNFLLWAGVLIFAAVLGGITRWLPILLFENFYRNGSLIFGGGQVLIPFLLTEFVELKHYLTSDEFLSGFALVQAVPGPVFSFSAFIGTLSMRSYGMLGQIGGGLMAAAGIFLPGTFLIFFVYRFWEELKKYRPIRAALEGINAASAGMVVAAALLLYDPIDVSYLNIGLTAVTFLLLKYTRIPAPILIIVGLLAGLFIKV